MSFIYFLLILMGVISIHEVGHYVFAKLFKVRVLEFALGFGPKIYERKGKETSFRVNVFPIGGYVRLAGEDLSEARDTSDEHSLYSKPAWQRLLISLAGPFFSIATGYLLFVVIVASWGVPSVTVDLVQPNSPAQEAGLMAGDVILEVNGRRVYDSYSISDVIKKGKPVRLTILRNGRRVSLTVIPRLFEETHFLVMRDVMGSVEEEIQSISGRPLTKENIESFIKQYVSLEFQGTTLKGLLSEYYYDAPRYAIGIYFTTVSNVIQREILPFEEGDVLLSVEGIEVKTSLDLSRVYQLILAGEGGAIVEADSTHVSWWKKGFGDSVNVEVLRNGRIRTMSVPTSVLKILMETAGAFKPGVRNIKPQTVFETIATSFDRCNAVLPLMWKSILGIFHSNEESGIVGPVGLISLVGEATRVGLEQVLTLIVFITMSLGVFNLLPLPALDGGRIVFALIEIIARRRVDPKIEAYIHFIGFVLLMFLMIYIMFSDIGRFFAK